jgi:hypothetical protein
MKSLLVSTGVIRKRLEVEFIHCKELGGDKDMVSYLWRLYPNVHQRCSAMISHLSIMLAVAAIFLRLAIDEHHKVVTVVAVVDVAFYMGLLWISLRCVRSFGVHTEFDKAREFQDAFLTEMAIKFRLLELMNRGTRIGLLLTFALMVIGAWYWVLGSVSSPSAA